MSVPNINETTIERLDRRLYGNGQPGDIQMLWDDVKDLQKQFGETRGDFLVFKTEVKTSVRNTVMFGGFILSAVNIGVAVWLHFSK